MRLLRSIFVLLCMFVIGSVGSMEHTRIIYRGYKNRFSTDTSNHITYDVGDVTYDGPNCNKRCANLCSVHSWCGAFYVDGIDQLCHLISDTETEDVVEYNLGPGQTYYEKNLISIEKDLAIPANLM